MEFAVVDVETTGLRPRTDRVVEVAIRRVTAAGELVDEFCTLVNPHRDVGPTWLHGVSAGAAAQAPSFVEIAPHLLGLFDGAILVAHNAWFDARFLAAEFGRLGLNLELDPLCTLELAYAIEPQAPRRLRDCCAFLGVSCGEPHQALNDCRMTAELLLALWSRWAYPAVPAPFSGPPGLSASRSRPSLSRSDVVDNREREGRYLDGLVARLRPNVDQGEVNPVVVAEYLNLLDRAIEDRRLSPDEAELLAEYVASRRLDRRDVEVLHAVYFADLLRLALADGVVSPAEEADLRTVAALLSIPWKGARVGASVESADASNRRGGGLPAGTTVCFTGEMSAPRSECARRAEQLGLVVLPRVTKGLKVLVVADPDTQSGKAAKARSYGTRIVAEATFWQMIGWTGGDLRS